jgi:ubiquinone/menaquinone biosynthesis C-methylase UbiE
MTAEPTPISRVNRPRLAARASYDRMSAWYDLLSGTSERALIDLGIQRLDVQTGESVLEIGPGTGHALARLTRCAGSRGKVYGMDLSGSMCQRARRACPTALMSCADAVFLPLPSGVMDAIFIAFTLELFDTPDIPQVLAECGRLLKPGRRLGVVSMSLPVGKPNLMVRIYEWAHRIMPAFIDCRPIRVEQALLQSGFAITTASIHSMWGLPVGIITAENNS